MCIRDRTITVNVTAAKGPSARYDHTFVEAATDALITGGNYTHTFDSATTNGVTVTSVGTFTPTNAVYTPSTGDLVLTIAGHSYTTSNTVSFATSSITFTCEMDGNTSTKSYPRATDPVAGIATAITSKTTDTITVNIGASPFVKFTPNGATYDKDTGDMILSIGSHSLTAGTSVKLNEEGLTFTCNKDGYSSEHKYPRASDPYYDTAIPITGVAGTTITLNVGAAYAGDQYTHRFVGAATSAIISGGTYPHAFRYALENAIATGAGGTQFTPTNATYDGSTGNLVLTVPAHGLGTNDTLGITTGSIVFACEMDDYGSDHPYPRASDPVAGINTAITAVTTDTITVKVGISSIVYFNVSAAEYDERLGHLKLNIGTHELTTEKSIKIAKESLRFTCSKDAYATQHRYPREGDPYYAGVSVAGVASATQFLSLIHI